MKLGVVDCFKYVCLSLKDNEYFIGQTPENNKPYAQTTTCSDEAKI